MDSPRSQGSARLPGWSAYSLLGTVLRSIIAICFLTFAFAAYVGSTNWWLSNSPWDSLEKDGFMNVPYHALVDRQPKAKPTGWVAPTLMAPYQTFKVFD